MELTRTIGALRTSERLLAEALVLVSDRHDDAEIREGARHLAGVSAMHVIALEPVQDRYGRARPRAPRRLRAALLNDAPAGAGLVRDLHDLAVLATSVQLGWTMLAGAARALGDEELHSLAARLLVDTDRQLAWLRSSLTARAGLPLTATPGVPARVAALPTFPWGPLACVGAILAGAGAKRRGRDPSAATAAVVLVAGIGAGMRLVARRVRRPLLVRRRLARARAAIFEHEDQPAG